MVIISSQPFSMALLPYESSFFATLKGKQEMVPLNLAPP